MVRAKRGIGCTRRPSSLTEMIRASLTRIERWNPVLRAYITVLADRALSRLLHKSWPRNIDELE